jgi:hypothetical protein
MFSEHFFEEMIEDGGTRGLNEDPVSDMYIFNPAGILLFSNDNVCRFFSDKLSLNAAPPHSQPHENIAEIRY